MTRRLGALLVSCALGACGGGTKPATTTPQPQQAAGSDAQSMQDAQPASSPAAGGPATTAPTPPDAGSASGPPIAFPNLDPDPEQAKAQVEQHLNVARAALSAQTPDPDTALREAREALKVDAANVDAAAYVAFAYYHKKQYDTAELVLDDLFKRPAAKQDATVFYVYGLVYDATSRPERAVLAYQQATKLDPNMASAWVDLGVHQIDNKQYADAQTSLERAQQLGRTDAVTMTALGSAYRGRSADYPAGAPERAQFIQQAEASYKRALASNPSYGPAYYDLGLLYLDADPFPSGGGTLDTMQRLNAAKNYFDQYKNMPGVDLKLYEERNKDVTKAIKHAKRAKGHS